MMVIQYLQFRKLKQIKLIQRGYFESYILNSKEEMELLDVLINYNYKPRSAHSTMSVTCIFSPRNAILFCNKTGEVIAYLEICFECSLFQFSPKSSVPKNLDGWDFCEEKLDKIKGMFRSSGIKYGVYKWTYD